MIACWRALLGLWAVAFSTVVVGPLMQTPIVRHYWPVAVEQVATTAHTHVQVTGRVKLVRHEGDGDTHIQLTGRTGFIVCECVPELPCKLPTVGQRITVYGISREDKEHHWFEVHPVERWESAK